MESNSVIDDEQSMSDTSRISSVFQHMCVGIQPMAAKLESVKLRLERSAVTVVRRFRNGRQRCIGFSLQYTGFFCYPDPGFA